MAPVLRRTQRRRRVQFVPSATIEEAYARFFEAKRNSITIGSISICSVCGSDYASTSLGVHLKAHFRIREEKCPHYVGTTKCKYETSDPALLTRHRENKHNHIPGKGSNPSRSRRNTGSQCKKGSRRKPYDVDIENYLPGSSPPSPFSNSSRSTPSPVWSTSSNSPASTAFSLDEEHMDMPDLESISSSVSDPLQEVLEILEAFNDHAMVPTPIPPSIDTWSNGGVYAASPDPYHSMTLPSNSLGLYEAFDATATSNVAYPPSRQNADACLPQEHAPALTYDTRPTPAIHSEQYPSMIGLQIPRGVDYNDPPSFLDAFTQPSSSGTSSSSSGYLF